MAFTGFCIWTLQLYTYIMETQTFILDAINRLTALGQTHCVLKPLDRPYNPHGSDSHPHSH